MAWGAEAAQLHLEFILILQKKAIRAINNFKYNEHDEHCKPYFKKNKILALIVIYIYETIIHSTKARNERFTTTSPETRTSLIYHTADLRNLKTTQTTPNQSSTPPILYIKAITVSKFNTFKKYLKLSWQSGRQSHLLYNGIPGHMPICPTTKLT